MDEKLSKVFNQLFSAYEGYMSRKPKKEQPQGEFPYQLQRPDLAPLISAIIQTESNWNPQAVSHAGAQGLMQLMPQIQKAFQVKDPFDPQQNVTAGEKLLLEEIGRFKDLHLALAAYNAGSPRISRALKETGGKTFDDIASILPKETRDYVPKVAKNFSGDLKKVRI